MLKQAWNLSFKDRAKIAWCALRGQMTVHTEDREGRTVSISARLDGKTLVFDIETLTLTEQYESLLKDT